MPWGKKPWPKLILTRHWTINGVRSAELSSKWFSFREMCTIACPSLLSVFYRWLSVVNFGPINSLAPLGAWISATALVMDAMLCGCTGPAIEGLQYIPRNMHTAFALLCFVVVIHWLIFPYPSGLLHWHCGNLTIARLPSASKATLMNMDK